MVKERIPVEVLVHVTGLGDRVFDDDEWAGTKGEARQLEGLQVTLGEPVPGLGLRAMVHLENMGDTDWISAGGDGASNIPAGTGFVGTRARALRLEGFAIECTGPAADRCEIVYWAHVQDIGDIGPFRNGEFCGSRGEGRRIESIKVQLVQEPEAEESSVPSGLALEILGHIQEVGDKAFKNDEWVGRPGGGKRVEGFQITLKDAIPGLALRYMAHVENVGDTNWVYSDCRNRPGAAADCAFVGTRARGLRIEGFAVECVGTDAGHY